MTSAHKLARLESASTAGQTHLRLRLAMIAKERETVITMRDRNEIGDAVMRRLLREFAHEAVLLHQRYAASEWTDAVSRAIASV